MQTQADTQPRGVNEYRIGDWVVLKGNICQIMELNRSKPGKHGAAKISFVGKNVVTNKTVVEIGYCGKTMPWVQKPKQNKPKAVPINTTM
jgi:translation elongation factor P/translation initiation factor 5A